MIIPQTPYQVSFAGGEGFLLLVDPPWRHRAIRGVLGRPRELPFRVARHVSRNIFIH